MLLSVDDGCASDVRVADLAQKYEIETVFYWPVEWHSLAFDKGYIPLSYSEASVIAKHFEIGSHTITHPHLTGLSITDAQYEIYWSREILQSIFGNQIRKFAPPRGYTNEDLTLFTLEVYETQRLTKAEGLLHIHPNSGANGNIHWLAKAKQMGYENIKEIWGHSHEFDKYDLWSELEGFLNSSVGN